MQKIITPTLLNEDSFEEILKQLPSEINKSTNIAIDLSCTEFIDPYSMTGLLQLEYYLKDCGVNFTISPPQLSSVLGYMERLNFFKYTSYIPEPGKEELEISKDSYHKNSDILLEIMPIEKFLDIHDIVTKVKNRAKAILQKHLHYDLKAIDNFIVALSEICQNIPEHSQSIGLVAIQKYYYEKRLGKNVVKIAVMDKGIGIKKSLDRKCAQIFKEKWSDEIAIRQALFEGVSRYDDPGRGNGLVRVGRLVEKWKGKITIRSGTAKLGVIPPWDTERPHQVSLSYFPGTQISMVLPEFSLKYQ